MPDPTLAALRTDALDSLRARMLLAACVLVVWVPEARGGHDARNLELPSVLKLVLSSCELLQGHWYLTLPLAGVGWLCCERWLLARASFRQPRMLGRAVLAALLLLAWILFAPLRPVLSYVP